MDSIVKYLRIFNTLLSGWNILLMVGYVIFIGVSQLTRKYFGPLQMGDTQFWVCFMAAVLVGLIAAFYASRKLHKYFSTLALNGNLLWLGVMIYLTITTYPGK
jgi:ABC-type antimicrobial peptide transport system permease subunit